MKFEITEIEKKFYVYLIVLLSLFYVLRIISGNYFLVDSYEYLEVAKIIADFSYFDPNVDPSLLTKRPFFYPLFLSLFLSFKVEILLIIQSILTFFNIVILVQILKKFDIKIKCNYLFFFLLTPSVFIYSNLIMSEWLLMLLINIKFFLIINKTRNSNFFYIQLITTLLAFTKPVFYPFIYLNFFYFLFYFIKKKTFSIWLFLPITILQLYVVNNKVNTGYKHFSSIQNKNLINYNLYYFKSFSDSPEEAKNWLNSVYDESYERMNFKEKNEYLHAEGVKIIKENFVEYSFYHFINSLRGIFDPGRFDLMTFFKNEDGSEGFLQILNGQKDFLYLTKNKFFLVYVLLLPIFLFGIIKYYYFSKAIFYTKFDNSTIYILMLFFYCVLVTGPINCSRFMMPLQGIVFVFSLIGYNKLEKE